MISRVENSHSKPEDTRTASASVPSVTVIVVTHGRAELLADTIESVVRSPYPRTSVLVVDQSPRYSEAASARLKRLCEEQGLRYLTLPVVSTPLARNVGMRHADGDVLLFVDDDIVAHPDLIARHASCYADPGIGGVAGRVLDRSTSRDDAPIKQAPTEQAPIKQAPTRQAPARHVADSHAPDTHAPDTHAPDGDRPGQILPDGTTVGRFFLDRRCEVEWGRGCNMSFRRSALEQLGGFDERYTDTAYNEEIDAFVRLRRAGFRVVFEPAAAVDHLRAPHGGARHGRLAQFEFRRASIIRCNTLFLLKLFEETPLHALVVAGRRGVGASVRGAREVRRRIDVDRKDSLISRLSAIRSLSRFLLAHVSGMLAYYLQRSDRLSRSMRRHNQLPEERVP